MTLYEELVARGLIAQVTDEKEIAGFNRFLECYKNALPVERAMSLR